MDAVNYTLLVLLRHIATTRRQSYHAPVLEAAFEVGQRCGGKGCRGRTKVRGEGLQR